MSDDTEDPDRQAILARRRIFVALTLSTLSAGTVACRPRPQPCLRLAPESDMRRADDGDTATRPPSDDPPRRR